MSIDRDAKNRRVPAPAWICLVLGLLAAFPYVVFIGANAANVRLSQGPLYFLEGSLLLWNGLVWGAISLLLGWILLADKGYKSPEMQLTCAAGMVLGGLGLAGNVLVFVLLMTRF